MLSRLTRLVVDGLTGDGEPAASHAGRHVIVDGAIPGETVEVEIEDKRSGRARLATVLDPSPQRVAPHCRHAEVCGGCTWQHIAYPEQLRLKRQHVADLLRAALGDAAPVVEPVIPTRPATSDLSDPAAAGVPAANGAPWGFRRKVHFVLGAGPTGRGLVLGHYRRGSREVVPVLECPVHAAAGNETAFAIRDILAGLDIPGVDADLRAGLARHVVVRVAAGSGERLAALVVTRDDDKRLRVATRRILRSIAAPDGLHLNVHSGTGASIFGRETRHLSGRARLREKVAGIDFLVSPTAFFQTNVQAAEALTHQVISAVLDSGARHVLDLYGGAGLFGLPLASRGCRVVVVEENAEALLDGEATREFNRIPRERCRFLRVRSETFVHGASSRLARALSPEAIVLDPPREGCPPGLLTAIIERWSPRRLVYVSCNPLALARDLAELTSHRLVGRNDRPYRLDRVQPIDMFPHTGHVETVVGLLRS
jgi:23S rRNA (uracil1939-C5)-methyltransferase